MSSRPSFYPQQVFLPGNDDMSGDLISLVTIIPKLPVNSYGISWTGTTPVGTLVCEVSNDYVQNIDGSARVAGTWNVMPFTDSTGTVVTSVAISGDTGNGFINISGLGGYALRLRYTAGPGVGTISAFFTAKV